MSKVKLSGLNGQALLVENRDIPSIKEFKAVTFSQKADRILKNFEAQLKNFMLLSHKNQSSKF